MELLLGILAGVLGFVLGTLVGANRTLRLIREGRRLGSSHARIARFMPADALPTRTPTDIIAGRVPVRLAGVTYQLPTLPRAAARDWLAQLDGRFAGMILALEDAGDDVGAILGLLVKQQDVLLDALLAYDTSGVLPPRAEIDDNATDAEILYGVLEVWRATNPLVGIATLGESLGSGTWRSPSSSLPTPTAGVLTTSSATSPTSNSSSTSTPPSSEPEMTDVGDSTTRWKRFDPAGSTPTTTSNTSPGSPEPPSGAAAP